MVWPMETNTINEGSKVKVSGRNLTVSAVLPIDGKKHPATLDLMVSGGWEPVDYLLTGSKGAEFLARRPAAGGNLQIVTSLRRW